MPKYDFSITHAFIKELRDVLDDCESVLNDPSINDNKVESVIVDLELRCDALIRSMHQDVGYVPDCTECDNARFIYEGGLSFGNVDNRVRCPVCNADNRYDFD